MNFLKLITGTDGSEAFKKTSATTNFLKQWNCWRVIKEMKNFLLIFVQVSWSGSKSIQRKLTKNSDTCPECFHFASLPPNSRPNRKRNNKAAESTPTKQYWRLAWFPWFYLKKKGRPNTCDLAGYLSFFHLRFLEFSLFVSFKNRFALLSPSNCYLECLFVVFYSLTKVTDSAISFFFFLIKAFFSFILWLS